MDDVGTGFVGRIAVGVLDRAGDWLRDLFAISGGLAEERHARDNEGEGGRCPAHALSATGVAEGSESDNARRRRPVSRAMAPRRVLSDAPGASSNVESVFGGDGCNPAPFPCGSVPLPATRCGTPVAFSIDHSSGDTARWVSVPKVLSLESLGPHMIKPWGLESSDLMPPLTPEQCSSRSARASPGSRSPAQPSSTPVRPGVRQGDGRTPARRQEPTRTR